MGFFTDILTSLVGRLHFMVFLGKSPAAEIKIEGKTIVIDIIHPIVAIELGIKEFLNGEGPYEVGVIETLKRMGYKLKIKYKMLELNI
ncbi:MAG: hypothetical protein J7K72_00745 [Candidatus Aenigmarchaeota archaeon]|nr:hypothetical protein [Candidatus Aenigmarchaeota archaeon]